MSDALNRLKSKISGLVTGKGEARIFIPEADIEELKEALCKEIEPGELICVVVCPRCKTQLEIIEGEEEGEIGILYE